MEDLTGEACDANVIPLRGNLIEVGRGSGQAEHRAPKLTGTRPPAPWLLEDALSPPGAEGAQMGLARLKRPSDGLGPHPFWPFQI